MPDHSNNNIVEALDRPAPPGRCSVAAVLRMLGAGMLTAALFASAPLHAWAERLPPGPAAETVLRASMAWHGAMQSLGTAQWHGTLRSAVQSAKDHRFTDPKQ